MSDMIPRPPGAAGGAPVSGQDAIRAARRRMGGQLAAWRRKAGLTQREVAYRAGYHRGAVAHAEIGDPVSRDLVEAADRMLGAGGRLTAQHDAITAAVTAARSQAARRARTRAAAAADDGPPAPTAAVCTVECACPGCDRRLAVRLAVSLLPAVPPGPPASPRL